MYLCQNTEELNEHHYKEDQLEKDWDTSIEDKKDAVISYAVKIIKQSVDGYTFDLAFGQTYTNVSDDLTEFLLITLEDICKGVINDQVVVGNIVQLALEAASFVMYDCADYELFDSHKEYVKAIDAVVKRAKL